MNQVSNKLRNIAVGVSILLSLVLSGNSFAETQKIIFKNEGKVSKEVKLNELSKLTAPKEMTVWEPHEDRDTVYRGYPLASLLTKVYGKAWKQAELILFICADGYQAPIPRARVESEDSLLAFEKVGFPFSVTNRFRGLQNVPLSPLYLVWNNKNNAQIRAELGSNWPYQIVGIELTQFATKYSKMIPPAKASADAKNGFVLFQKHCMTCHKINGNGGEIGPELNSPKSVTERPGAREWLTQWLDEPQKMKPGTTMPPLNPNLKHRDKALSQLIAYLEVMAPTGKH